MTDHAASDKVALQELLQLEGELSNRIKNLSADMSKSHSLDSGEQAVERENDEVIVQLEGDASEELAQVRHALARINQGRYHECEECGDEISGKRLVAIPYTTLCFDCANKSTDS